MKRVFADSDTLGQKQSGPSRPGLLPIGNHRPRSLQVPSSPFSRKSNESRRSTDGTSPAASNSHSSGISSPDILDFMFIPSVPPIPSRPHPIKVIRKSLDSFEGISENFPTTAEALRQTFPETPQAFSPLFSASVGALGVSPLPPSSVGTPRTPFSAVHTRGKLRKGVSNPIERATTLHTKKPLYNSNRTLMTPIPSGPGTPQSQEAHMADNIPKNSKFEAQQLQAAANLLVTSFSASGMVSPPVTPPARPTGRVSGDLETPAGRVELLEEISRSTPEVKEPETEPSEDAPSQQPTPALPEKSLNQSFLDLGAAEGEWWLSTPDSQDNDGDSVNAGSPTKISVQGSTQSDDQLRRSGTNQRLQPLGVPAVNSDNKPTATSGSITKKSDGSSGVRQEREQGSAGPSFQIDVIPKTEVVPVVPADTAAPVATPARSSSITSIRSSNTSEQSSTRVNVLSSLDISSSHPSPNQPSHTTPNVSPASSPVSPSQRFATRSSSGLNPAPTSSASQVRDISPAPPSSTPACPPQYGRSNSLGVPSFASFLRHSCTDLVAIHPPPPYQTALFSKNVSVDRGNEPPAGSGSSLPSYTYTLPDRRGGGQQPAQPVQLPQAQRSAPNFASVSKGVVRERSDSVSDTRMPRNRPLGPRKPSSSQGPNKVYSLRADRSRQGSVSLAYPHTSRSGVGLGAPPNHRKLSIASNRGKSRPRFPTVPVKWRGYTLDVARWTFNSQELQEIASRAIKASAESYHVRLLRLETLDTRLPEELHRLELLATDLKSRIRAIATAKRELLDTLTAHASGVETLDHYNLEGIVEELGDITELAEEVNDELYTVADQIAQLKRLKDVHSSSALAVSLRKLNASFLRQAAENQLFRERVATLEAERDTAWTQAEHVAQEFDDLSTKLEQGVTSIPTSASNSRRASRVSAVRKSSIRASKSGLRQSMVGKPTFRTPKRSSSVSSSAQPSEDIPPIPPALDMQDLGSNISRPSRRRPSFIQTTNLPEQITPGTLASFESDLSGLTSFVTAGLYSEMTPTTGTRAMAQAQRELCEMLGISLADLDTLQSHAPQSRPRSMSELSHSNRLSLFQSVRRNSGAKTSTPKRFSQQYQDYLLSPYDVSPRLSLIACPHTSSQRDLTLAHLTTPE